MNILICLPNPLSHIYSFIGPKESRDEAMKEVISCMENPFDDIALPKLSVHLDVDAKSADSWYKAK